MSEVRPKGTEPVDQPAEETSQKRTKRETIKEMQMRAKEMSEALGDRDIAKAYDELRLLIGDLQDTGPKGAAAAEESFREFTSSRSRERTNAGRLTTPPSDASRKQEDRQRELEQETITKQMREKYKVP